MLYPKTRAVLFMRVNRRFVHNQLLATRSVERQRELGQAVARKLQATIVREYIDMSGAVLLANRPELQAMLMSLKHYPAQFVIAEDWSAFGTSPDVTTAVLTAITHAGAELVIGDGALNRPDGTDDAESAA
jgi:DNA invertase Pin-like site-specific DNA recombinase